MPITGELFIGARRVRRAQTFTAVNPATGEHLSPGFSAATDEDVSDACGFAWSAFPVFAQLEPERRARFLEAVAEEILQLGDQLLERAMLESGLPPARLTGERARTVGQLRLFADELRNGGWMGIRLDPALPDRKPMARPDLRMRKVPLGPVAVFGASNFPLAFSVAGGDTAAAWAAGCPVIVKGHPAHPGTSELVAQAITSAIHACGLPAGVFALLNSDSHALGSALVAHPHIKAVGFTGSRAGGLALMEIARKRPEPIPVYAEMSSINPVIVLPGALADRSESLGENFIASVTLGAGQFCTNPGLLVAVESPDLERFISAAVETLGQHSPATMLTPGIHAAYDRGLARLASHPKVSLLGRALEPSGRHCGRGALFSVTASDFISAPELSEEVFGASSVLVRCTSVDEMVDVLESLEGQLTATLHLTPTDYSLAKRLLPTIERKAGRLIVNGWPTGVEVSHAMVHGGPYPATSDGRSTSVGTLAIERFLRPICYQDFPAELLPEVLRDDAPKRPRRLDGVYEG